MAYATNHSYFSLTLLEMHILILKIETHIRLYGSYGVDLGRSITMATNKIHAISVDKPVCESSVFPLTAKAVQSKGHTLNMC